MTVTVAGVAWVVLERGDDGPQAQGAERRRRGLWLALLAAVGQAVGMVLARQGLGDYDPFAATFIRVLGAMVGYLAVITLVRRWKAIAAGAAHARAMAIVVCGTLVGPFLGVALCMVALRYSNAGVTATIVNTTPVLILPFAVLVYREKVSLRAAGGAALSVAGVALLAF
jgi:drug/metabolite transporter (DMT)-like permease